MNRAEIIQSVKSDFDKVIVWSQDLYDDTMNSGPILNEWFAAKRKFIERFGGLIYECPDLVSFELDDVAKKEKINELCDIVADRFDNPILADFIYDSRADFYNNITSKEYNYKDNYKNETIVVPKGFKIIKAFKLFEKDKEKLTEMQNIASMVVQENKVSGILCISVHPLDFLSSSENTYNWHSCHALDGDYRAGNLSYMTDETTFVIYLRGKDKVKLPNFPEDVLWNSKKWRMLGFLNQDETMIFAGRQYPFFSREALDKVKDKFYEKIFDVSYRYFRSYDWTNFLLQKQEMLPGRELTGKYILDGANRLVMLSDVVKDNCSLHYNDLLYSHFYTPYYLSMFAAGKLKPMYVGNTPTCPKCGKYNLFTSESLLCQSCELTYGKLDDPDVIGYCDKCGARMMRDDAYYIEPDGELYCEDCYNNYCERCNCCEGFFLTEDLVYEDDEYHCEGCRNPIKIRF